jgi:hypothetical protein
MKYLASVENNDMQDYNKKGLTYALQETREDSSV